MLHLFFEPILFEKLPATSVAPQASYLKEVAQAAVFIILIGRDYGFETANGISPTELEYNLAQQEAIFSLAFIKKDSENGRHPKENLLFQKIQNNLSYKRFSSTPELLTEVTKALVSVLQQKGLLQLDRFDSSIAQKASLADIDAEKVNTFISIAQQRRGFPLREGTPIA